MGIKIQSITEAVGDNGIKILVHGPAGAGKTLLCATTGKPTLIISAESGLLSIKGAVQNGHLPEKVLELVQVVEIKNLEDLKDVYDMLKGEHLYDWVALDSISEIAEVVLEYEKTQSKDARQAYGNLSTEMNAILRKFRDLPKYNVIMSCKQQRLVDQDTDLVSYGPSMPGGKLAGAIPYLFDEVFALRVEKDDETGEEYRTLQTNRDRKYEAKDRSGMLDMFEPAVLFDIMKKIQSAPEVSSVDVPSNEEHVDVEKPADSIEGASDEDVIVSDRKQYWEHVPSSKLLITEKGDDISELLSNSDVAELTKLQYAKKLESITDEDS
jgi:hypothetical protein